MDDPPQVVGFGNLRRQLQEFLQAGKSRLELSLPVCVERLRIVPANEFGRSRLVFGKTPWNGNEVEEEPDERRWRPGTLCHGCLSLP